MRILLDESVPRPLAARLSGHEVATVARVGWAGLRNGELLRRAAESFDAFVTGDQGLRHQQNLRGSALRIVVVVARDNRVDTYLALADRILAAVESIAAGGVVEVRER